MYNALQHAHSGLRWIVLALLLYAIFNAFKKWRSGANFLDQDRKKNLFALIATHTQFLLGIALYFISPKVQFGPGMMKDSMTRFYAVEHITLMIIAIVLITLGYSLSKRIKQDPKKFKRTFIFYTIGLILMLVAIPWPPRFGAGWF